MKRREVLKKIGLTTGFVLASPSIVSLLQSCVSETEKWIPQFFSNEQATVLRSIVDVFLPKTDSPSATEVNVPEFIDIYNNEVMDIKEQDRFKETFNSLLALIKATYNKNLNKVTIENYENLIDKHMLFEQPPILEIKPKTISDKPMTISELLNSIKWMSINAFVINETVGENILAYDPFPGSYYCGDLNELTGGKSWSL